MRPDTLAVNYLQICEPSAADHADKVREVARGIRAVMAGEIEAFVIDYPCHSPQEKRWFYMRATRLTGATTVRVVVSHENIIALKVLLSKGRTTSGISRKTSWSTSAISPFRTWRS